MLFFRNSYGTHQLNLLLLIGSWQRGLTPEVAPNIVHEVFTMGMLHFSPCAKRLNDSFCYPLFLHLSSSLLCCCFFLQQPLVRLRGYKTVHLRGDLKGSGNKTAKMLHNVCMQVEGYLHWAHEVFSFVCLLSFLFCHVTAPLTVCR